MRESHRPAVEKRQLDREYKAALRWLQIQSILICPVPALPLSLLYPEPTAQLPFSHLSLDRILPFFLPCPESRCTYDTDRPSLPQTDPQHTVPILLDVGWG